jgi:hypothetical protein
MPTRGIISRNELDNKQLKKKKLTNYHSSTDTQIASDETCQQNGDRKSPTLFRGELHVTGKKVVASGLLFQEAHADPHGCKDGDNGEHDDGDGKHAAPRRAAARHPGKSLPCL